MTQPMKQKENIYTRENLKQKTNYTGYGVAEKPHRGLRAKAGSRWTWSPEDKGSDHSVGAWRNHVPGKLMVLLETLPKTDSQREGKPFHCPPPGCPSPLPLSPIGQTQSEPS